MIELFASIYLDEDVNVLVSRLVRRRGFDAITVYDAGRAGDSDPEQLAYAISVGRAIVSHNRRDFLILANDYGARGLEHHGIIVAVRRSPFELAQRLDNILNTVTADEMRNQVLYI